MRKFAWFIAFAAAALFFGAPESAFAHGNHHHVQQTQTAPAAIFDNVKPAENTSYLGETVSAGEPRADKCPHGQGVGCEFCCACVGGVSAAIAAPFVIDRDLRVQQQDVSLGSPYRVWQTVLDLSRPPKSFA
jgi:hypothetical protein